MLRSLGSFALDCPNFLASWPCGFLAILGAGHRTQAMDVTVRFGHGCALVEPWTLILRLRHGRAGHRVIAATSHGRYSGLGMDALVIARNNN